MTILSDAVPVPWERTPFAPSASNYTPTPHQSIVRIDSTTALIGYGEQVTVTGVPYNYNFAECWLRVVRYTEDGPRLGAALRLPPPIKGTHTLLGLFVSGDGTVWIVTGVGSWNSNEAPSYLRVGKVTVNTTTLTASVSWRYQFPTLGYHEDTYVDIWPAQRTLLVAVGQALSPAPDNKELWLINLDTGAKTAAAPLPLVYSTNRHLYTRAMSFHPGRQELLMIGDRTTAGWDRPTFWTAPIAPNSIGAWTRFVPPGLPVGYNDDVYSEAWNATVLGSGWMAIGIWSRDDEYTWVNDYWGSSRLRNFFFNGSVIAERPDLSQAAYGSYNGLAQRIDIEVHDAGVLVMSAEPTGRTVSTQGTGVGGVRAIELQADGTTLIGSQILPRTSNILDREATISATALGGGRFIYLVSGAGVTSPAVTTRLASLEFAVFAAGPIMKPPFVPGMKATDPPEENRCVFRRVN